LSCSSRRSTPPLLPCLTSHSARPAFGASALEIEYGSASAERRSIRLTTHSMGGGASHLWLTVSRSLDTASACTVETTCTARIEKSQDETHVLAVRKAKLRLDGVFIGLTGRDVRECSERSQDSRVPRLPRAPALSDIFRALLEPTVTLPCMLRTNRALLLTCALLWSSSRTRCQQFYSALGVQIQGRARADSRHGVNRDSWGSR